jgi:FAD:protein FMN transferase
VITAADVLARGGSRSSGSVRARRAASPGPGGSEHAASFACFGSQCTVIVSGSGAETAIADARRRLLEWHGQFSRFEPDSEISRLNVDPRETVPVSPLMRRMLQAAVRAANDTGGLVDPTLVNEIERVGYAGHFDGPGVPLPEALAIAPPRAPGRARNPAPWRSVTVDRRSSTVTRPPGVGLDPGGIAKGLFADEIAAGLGTFAAFAIDCAGDLRLGGAAGLPRAVEVVSPFDGSALHTFAIAGGGVATSGIGKRSWMKDGRPAHHLLDPATGAPVFTGIVQATALAPTATEAEALSKAALLSGPDGAAGWLVHGGLVVYDDNTHRLIESR